jgi:cystathionine beta-lyase/cystathionine gamma-synthase
MRFDTRAVHGGEKLGDISRFGDVVAPIHLATTFAREELEGSKWGYEY